MKIDSIEKKLPRPAAAAPAPRQATDQRALHDRLAALTPAQRAELLRRAAASGMLPGGPSIRHSLTRTQFGIWLYEQLNEGSTAYVNPAGLRLRGDLHTGALRRTLAWLEQRHELLRTTYGEDADGEPYAVVWPPAEVPLDCIDVSRAADREAETERCVAAATRPFDLAAGPVWRAALVRLAPGDHILIVSLHHIVSDGWSLGVLFRDLWAGYAAFRDGHVPASAPAGSFFQLAAGLERTALRHASADRAYWTQCLAGVTPHLDLPYEMHAQQSARGGTVPFALPDSMTIAFRRRCAARGATLFTGLAAAFATVITGLSGARSFVLAIPVAARDDPQSANMVGCLLNTVPLALRLDQVRTADDLLDHCRDVTAAAIAHSRLPFAEIVSLIPRAVASASMPFANLMVVENNAPAGSGEFAGLRVERYPLPVTSVKHDLALVAGHARSGVLGEVEYSERFTAATAERVASATTAVAARLAAGDPGVMFEELVHVVRRALKGLRALVSNTT